MVARCGVLAVLLNCLSLAGCAIPTSGGLLGQQRPAQTSQFDQPEFDIVFDYPEQFTPTNVTTILPGASRQIPGPEFGLSLDNHLNLISVRRDRLARGVVTPANIDSIKTLYDQAYSRTYHTSVHGTEVQYGSMLGLSYEDEPTLDNARATRTILFDRLAQYDITCQWTPQRRAEVEAACQQMLSTLRHR